MQEEKGIKVSGPTALSRYIFKELTKKHVDLRLSRPQAIFLLHTIHICLN